MKTIKSKTDPSQTSIIIYCAYCGSQNISKDATAVWDTARQHWELSDVMDLATCEQCGAETTLREAPIMGQRGIVKI